jgi:hypothetical protein
MKLYIAYGTEADQVIALRLQALAAVNGLSAYVPPVFTRRVRTINLEPESDAKLLESDVILGVVTTSISDTLRQELETARELSKEAIIIADPSSASPLQGYFPGRVVVIDPANPAAAEEEIVKLLKRTEIEQKAKTALIALGTLALGLMLFAPQE